MIPQKRGRLTSGDRKAGREAERIQETNVFPRAVLESDRFNIYEEDFIGGRH